MDSAGADTALNFNKGADNSGVVLPINKLEASGSDGNASNINAIYYCKGVRAKITSIEYGCAWNDTIQGRGCTIYVDGIVTNMGVNGNTCSVPLPYTTGIITSSFQVVASSDAANWWTSCSVTFEWVLP